MVVLPRPLRLTTLSLVDPIPLTSPGKSSYTEWMWRPNNHNSFFPCFQLNLLCLENSSLSSKRIFLPVHQVYLVLITHIAEIIRFTSHCSDALQRLDSDDLKTVKLLRLGVVIRKILLNAPYIHSISLAWQRSVTIMAWMSGGSTNTALIANLAKNQLITTERVKTAMLGVRL